MKANAIALHLTEDEYLALEDKADEKHEFVNGEMIAMSGGTPAHGAIAANLSRVLGTLLKGRPCLVLSSDVRVSVGPTGMYTYPDLSIVCGRPQYAPKSRVTITNPLVLVEVLSDSTEAYDRGAKSAHYRHIESLKAYILVSQAPRRIEVFTRMPAGGWLLNEAQEGELRIPCLEVALSVDEVYLNLELLEDEPPAEA